METVENWKIWPPYEVFYLESMLTIVDTAIEHYTQLDKVITDQELFDQNPSILIDLSENILNQAAKLSRYFWPTRKQKIHQLRGEKLRHHFQIDDQNVLKNKDVRNFIEHFDENLDKFLTGNVAGNFVPSVVIFRSSELNEVTFVFRAYVVDEFRYIALNKRVDILPIIQEIFRIQNKLVDFLQTGRLK